MTASSSTTTTRPPALHHYQGRHSLLVRALELAGSSRGRRARVVRCQKQPIAAAAVLRTIPTTVIIPLLVVLVLLSSGKGQATQ